MIKGNFRFLPQKRGHPQDGGGLEYGPGWFHSEKDLMIICLVPLQVANLPLETTRGELENVFSELGPIKKCFVLKPKEGKKSNLGFVTFAMSGDCKAAAVSIIFLSTILSTILT